MLGWVASAIGLAALTAVALGCSQETRPSGAVLILLDTLRSDHVGAYGHDRPTTANLDRLAEQGVLFEQAVSYSAWTLPSVVAMFSGRYPTRADFDGKLERSLVEPLAEHGFRTAAFTEGGYVSSHFGFDRGFDVFEGWDSAVRIGQQPGAKRVDLAVAETFGAAQKWLRANAAEPFFLFVHTYEVHLPYIRAGLAQGVPRAGLSTFIDMAELDRIRHGQIAIGADQRAYLEALYDGGVRRADRHVGELMAVLEELGLRESTLVVVSSDHGEDLGERIPHYAAEHGHTLYDELVTVPLIIRDPTLGVAASRIPELVRSVDVLPTILDRLGVEAELGEGQSLVPLMRGVEPAERFAFSHLARYGPERVSLRSARWKLIRNLTEDTSTPPVDPNAPPLELYDLRADPAEQHNLADASPDDLDRLQSKLDELLERRAENGPADFGPREGLSRELRTRLKELGYLR
jgi:arylsulfatase A-like enzyme